jgi:hypothetical protein
VTQEEGYNRKLKALEEQKKKLEERIRAEGNKSLNYEAMIRKINDEREDERRKTMQDHESVMRNLDKAQREKDELRKFLEETEQ